VGDQRIEGQRLAVDADALVEALEVGAGEAAGAQVERRLLCEVSAGAERQDDPEAAAPTFDVSRSRGERRKAKQLQKARAGDGM